MVPEVRIHWESDRVKSQLCTVQGIREDHKLYSGLQIGRKHVEHVLEPISI